MKLADLKEVFSGDVITPESPLYATAQNALFAKGAPVLVLRPRTNKDIPLGIRYAQENKLKLSVRSGGHSGAGFSTNTGGVVIELSYMDSIDLIDKTKHIVRIGGGAHWGDVAQKLHDFGLAVSSGDTLSVGVGGLTLGGGIGWMVRKYGLAIDSLVAAEVVLSDGRAVRASADKEPDLFWALRGGGGNFGVVTSFEFAAHPVGKVYAGVVVYPLENLVKIIGGWRDAMRNAPEELTTMLVTMSSFMGMPPSAIVMCCYVGDENRAEDAVRPFRQLGKSLSDDVEWKEYYEVLQEAHPPEGVKIINKTGFVPDFSDELVELIAGLYSGEAGPVLQIRSIGGAMNRVPVDATAFAHRTSEAMIVSPAFVPVDATKADQQKALVPWQKIEPFIRGGYCNFFSERDEDMDSMYPKATYKRLVDAKKKYDPDNLFDQNFNIKP